VAAGLVTADRLRGPAFRRAFPDVYVRADVTLDLPLRSLAAYRLVEGRGVLSGYSAAVVLGADCAPLRGVPAEVTVPGGGQRRHPGLRVHGDRLHPGEVTRLDGVAVTTPLRTAFDLACRLDPDEAVVAVDRLANEHRFHPDLLLNFGARYRGRRGVARLAEVLCRAERFAGSPMETRMRLVVVAAGLPRPQVQWVVQDVAARTAYWLDLAWPWARVGAEFDGGVHMDPARVRSDIARHTRLVDLGWRVYRYTAADVLRSPERIVADLRRALGEQPR
jgi:hypothetical protein